jgi:vacuolar-type H+-ATPase subunit H
MTDNNPIQTIKDIENKAKNIIEEAKIKARKDLLEATKKQDEEYQKVIEKTSQETQAALKSAVEKIENIINEKESEAAVQAEAIIKNSEKNRSAAIKYIIDNILRS